MDCQLPVAVEHKHKGFRNGDCACLLQTGLISLLQPSFGVCEQRQTAILKPSDSPGLASLGESPQSSDGNHGAWRHRGPQEENEVATTKDRMCAELNQRCNKLGMG